MTYSINDDPPKALGRHPQQSETLLSASSPFNITFKNSNNSEDTLILQICDIGPQSSSRDSQVATVSTAPSITNVTTTGRVRARAGSRPGSGTFTYVSGSTTSPVTGEAPITTPMSNAGPGTPLSTEADFGPTKASFQAEPTWLISQLTSVPSQASTAVSSSPKNVSKGGIAGGVLGGIVIILSITIFLIWRRRRKVRPTPILDKESSVARRSTRRSSSE